VRFNTNEWLWDTYAFVSSTTYDSTDGASVNRSLAETTFAYTEFPSPLEWNEDETLTFGAGHGGFYDVQSGPGFELQHGFKLYVTEQ
jgi:hypothetical protein